MEDGVSQEMGLRVLGEHYRFGVWGVLVPSLLLIEERSCSRPPGLSPESCLSHLLNLMGPFSLEL